MYSSVYWAIGHRAAVTIKKISVNADKISARAISFGVRCRMGPFDQGDHPVQERLARPGGDLRRQSGPRGPRCRR